MRGLADSMSMVQFREWVAFYGWKEDEREQARLEAKADKNRAKAKEMM